MIERRVEAQRAKNKRKLFDDSASEDEDEEIEEQKQTSAPAKGNMSGIVK